jgi:hypothetical protein
MSTLSKRNVVLLVLGVVVLAVVAFALIKRDAIGDLILKGGDTSLTGQAAQSSPQAKLALEFLSALRASDVKAMTELATGEQAARIQQEATKPTPDFQNMKTMMLADLPADSTELRSQIKSVQTHKNKGVVTFETKANSWMVMLEEANGKWKVSGF